ncbi:substrate-binding periplasmic protein [Sneathiella litorea]|nr:ABC transporter substrate-binding protein [Sneathiella litorea]
MKISQLLMYGFIAVSMSTPSLAADINTVSDGKLTIAFTGDMPGSGWQDGKMIGYDGEIMQKISEKMGIPITPALMEWSGTIASVQSGRVDAMLGTMGWTKQRTEIMTLSEPLHYFKNGIMQSKDNNWDKLSDLEGRKVGTITGFSFVPELRKIKGLELSLYDTSDAAVRDLIAGRIDAVIGDPPVVAFAISQNPDWGMHFLAFSDQNEDFRLLTGLGQVVVGMNKDNPELAEAVNAVIKDMWQTCEMKEIGTRYGLVADVWYTPAGENFRAGVDRPEGYQLPTCN